jgi:hypothetical protein
MTVGRIPNIEGGIQPTLLTTTGDIMYASSASNPARLGVGSTGQVLTVAAGVPSWATSSSGGMTLISTTTLSGTSTTLSSIPQTYTKLFVVLSGLTYNTSDRTPRCLINNSTTLSNYVGLRDTTVISQVNSRIFLSEANTLRTNADNFWSLEFNNYASTTAYKSFTVIGTCVKGTSAREQIFNGGTFQTNTAITSLVFDVEGTNTMATGTVLLYGVK